MNNSNCVCSRPFEYVKYHPKLKLSQITGAVETILINKLVRSQQLDQKQELCFKIVLKPVFPLSITNFL